MSRDFILRRHRTKCKQQFRDSQPDSLYFRLGGGWKQRPQC